MLLMRHRWRLTARQRCHWPVPCCRASTLSPQRARGRIMQAIVPKPTDRGSPDSEARYFNRELSWLAFNRRVLDESENRAHPLLERLRFLSISGNNLDEFFMVRVAGLKGQQLQGIEQNSVDGLTIGQQLTAISADADALMGRQQIVWYTIREELEIAGVRVLDHDEVADDQADWL